MGLLKPLLSILMASDSAYCRQFKELKKLKKLKNVKKVKKGNPPRPREGPGELGRTSQERLQNKIGITRKCLPKALARGLPRKGSRTR